MPFTQKFESPKKLLNSEHALYWHEYGMFEKQRIRKKLQPTLNILFKRKVNIWASLVWTISWPDSAKSSRKKQTKRYKNWISLFWRRKNQVSVTVTARMYPPSRYPLVRRKNRMILKEIIISVDYEIHLAKGFIKIVYLKRLLLKKWVLSCLYK